MGDIGGMYDEEWGIWIEVVVADMDRGRNYGWGKDIT